MLKLRTKYLLMTLLIAVLCLALSACDMLPHNHTAKSWQTDERHHWKTCVLCGEQFDRGFHSYSAWEITTQPTDSLDGEQSRHCLTCGYTQTKVVPCNHTHKLAEDITYDEQTHTGYCTCGKQMTGEHDIVWSEVAEVLQNGDGEVRGRCSQCGYVVTQVLHDLTYNVSANTHKAYCKNCGIALDEEENHVASDWIVDIKATSTTQGSQHKQCTVCGYLLQTQVIDVLVDVARSVSLYAINDFHGATENMAKVCGYLDSVNNGNTLLINSGDMFQGSLESNYNRGNLLAQCMDIVGFTSMTIGNHEFDWGTESLQSLNENTQTPFLGANIYHYNTLTGVWGDFASELAQEYVIVQLENGLKVGIIGVIDSGQISSITSNLVAGIGFKDPADVVPDLSRKLRNTYGCDIVVVSAHAGEDVFLDNYGWDITDYADVVFCAHTHQNEYSIRNGVPFIQGGSYGRYISNVELSVDANGEVVCTSYTNVDYNSRWQNNTEVKTLIDNSNRQIEQLANKQLATIDGTLYKSGELPRIICRAMANYAIECGYDDIVLAMANARTTIYYGDGILTYSELYEGLPFDNQMYIAEVSGKDIFAEVQYNAIWRVSNEPIYKNKTYKIVVIDYLLFHQNDYRQYDYFSSAFETDKTPPIALTKNGQLYNYRELTSDFLQQQRAIHIADYGVNTNTDVNKLGNYVTLKYNSQVPSIQDIVAWLNNQMFFDTRYRKTTAVSFFAKKTDNCGNVCKTYNVLHDMRKTLA